MQKAKYSFWPPLLAESAANPSAVKRATRSSLYFTPGISRGSIEQVFQRAEGNRPFICQVGPSWPKSDARSNTLSRLNAGVWPKLAVIGASKLPEPRLSGGCRG